MCKAVGVIGLSENIRVGFGGHYQQSILNVHFQRIDSLEVGAFLIYFDAFEELGQFELFFSLVVDQQVAGVHEETHQLVLLLDVEGHFCQTDHRQNSS